MILVTGGAFQGKQEFAAELYQKQNLQQYQPEHSEKDAAAEKIMTHPAVIKDGADALEAELIRADIVIHFHRYIRRLLERERDPWNAVKELLEQNPDVILVVTELGCGIVPADPFDRSYRETSGRICCFLASEARHVYRVFCGVGTKIK